MMMIISLNLKKIHFSTASWGPLKKNPGAWARAQCAHWLRRPWARLQRELVRENSLTGPGVDVGRRRRR